MIRVAIVSNNAKGLTVLLDWLDDINVTVVAPSTMEDTQKQVLECIPDIIVIEQNLDSLNTDLLCHLLYKDFSRAQSIILTDGAPTFEMLKSTGFSVRGYITKEQRSSLAKVVRVVHDGEAWLPRNIVTEMLNHFAEMSSVKKPAKTKAKK